MRSPSSQLQPQPRLQSQPIPAPQPLATVQPQQPQQKARPTTIPVPARPLLTFSQYTPFQSAIPIQTPLTFSQYTPFQSAIFPSQLPALRKNASRNRLNVRFPPVAGYQEQRPTQVTSIQRRARLDVLRRRLQCVIPGRYGQTQRGQNVTNGAPGQIPASFRNHRQKKQGVIDARDYQSPQALHPVPGSSILVDFNVPTWKRLCSSAFSLSKVIFLVETIFTSKEEIKVVCNLRGDDAQSFIDATHKVCTFHSGSQPDHLRSCDPLTPEPPTYAV